MKDEGLKEIIRKQREFFKERWDRVIPIPETLLGDNARWEKAKFLGFGEGTSIYDSSLVFGDVKVGLNTWIGPFTILDGEGGLEIGDFCNISAGVQIYTHDSVKWAISGGKSKYEYAPTKIGNCCYIGPNAIIQKGIEIGDHCIIGANSFVNRNIPSHSMAVGSPARIIGKIKIDGEEVKIERIQE